MKQLIEHLESINAKIKYNGEKLGDKQLKCIPMPLQEFYKMIDSVEINYAPFNGVEIYDIEKSIDRTAEWLKFRVQNQEITSEWFVFGEGMYSIILLCAYIEDEEGLSFTYWDYESGAEIDGALCENLYELLLDIEEDYEDIINKALERYKEDIEDDY